LSQVQNIFVTGLSGSVGSYVLDQFKNDPRYQIFALIRKPQKMSAQLQDVNNITLIQGDLENVYKNKDLLKQMDYAILIATSWGGFKEPWRQNVYSLFRILRSFDSARFKKAVYFSTASILDRDHKPVEAIRELGTNYIRSKFLAYKMLQKSKAWYKSRIVTVFPTWVYGGDKTHPYSHAASGLPGAKNWIRFGRFFDTDFKFHFIHCQDIAKMTKYFLENNLDKQEFVLGNAPLTVGDFLKQLGEYYGYKTPFQVRFPIKLAYLSAKFFKKHSWDQYCLNYRHFVYKTTNCKSLGLTSDKDTIAGVLKSL